MCRNPRTAARSRTQDCQCSGLAVLPRSGNVLSLAKAVSSSVFLFVKRLASRPSSKSTSHSSVTGTVSTCSVPHQYLGSTSLPSTRTRGSPKLATTRHELQPFVFSKDQFHDKGIHSVALDDHGVNILGCGEEFMLVLVVLSTSLQPWWSCCCRFCCSCCCLPSFRQVQPEVQSAFIACESCATSITARQPNTRLVWVTLAFRLWCRRNMSFPPPDRVQVRLSVGATWALNT